MLKYANLHFIIPLYKDPKVNGLLIVFSSPVRKYRESYCSHVGLALALA